MLNAALTSPFAMLLDLDSVVSEMERSERLQRLQRRVYHPLDKPLIPKAKGQGGGLNDEIDEDELG
jgi:hypothetical protein